MKVRWLPLILCLLTSVAVAQEKKVYVSRDANGVLIFSDSPLPGAEEVSLTTRPNIMDPTEVSFPDKKAPKPIPFKVEINQPEHLSTVRDNTGSVYITGRITPRFQRGYRVRLVVNGEPFGEPQNTAVFVLRDMDRGEHNLQLELFDDNGKLIAKSPTTIFYLHRARIISPN